MSATPKPVLSTIPSVDYVLQQKPLPSLSAQHGHALVLDAVRIEIESLRIALSGAQSPGEPTIEMADLAQRCAARVAETVRPSLRPVLNLTGTVLHTNLGRAPLPEAAIEAMAEAARGNVNLEFDVDRGRRGDRDSHLEAWLCRLTGAEAATVVNNNAAAVLLLLNTLALRRRVAVSRGELIEIGGAFRMPDIMARAGCRLVEVGTTNRTHLRDFESAAADGIALIMKVHTSNYVVQGFTATVAEPDLATLAKTHDIPFVVDLGSGTLIDLEQFGLPHEPTVAETLAAGADLVTFSGDKLLGGPQAGIIVGRGDLVTRIKRNPMKRAMRLDKLTIAALGAILPLYANPDRVRENVPTLRLLARPLQDIHGLATALQPVIAKRLEGVADVDIIDCQSEIGSGALPTEGLASAALRIRPTATGRGSGKMAERLASAFRALPIPVIGRIRDGALIFDLRCLEDPGPFTTQLDALNISSSKRR